MVQGTRVTVLWLDAAYTGDEQAEPSRISPSVPEDQLTLTAGFWVGEDASSIAIAHEWYPWGKPAECRGVYRIPTEMVIWIAEEGVKKKSVRKKNFRLPQRTV